MTIQPGQVCVACHIKDQEAEQARNFGRQVSNGEEIQPHIKGRL